MIEIRSLSKNFESLSALQGVSAIFHPGDRVVLIGRNGSGKTTLIRCIMGLMNFEGSVNVFGHHSRDARTDVLKMVGFVPQVAPTLGMSVSALLEYASRFHDVTPEYVISVAKKLNLDIEEIGNKIFKKLSGGMRHKLLIALALAHKPRVLILDEPTANLDPEGRQYFLNLLCELPPETMVLMTSHRAAELKGFINRIVEMDQGQITREEVCNVVP